jgi:hypothetical protein
VKFVPGWRAGNSIGVEIMTLRYHGRTKKTNLLTLSNTTVEDKQLVCVGMFFAVWTGHMNSKSNTETSLSGHSWQSGNIMHPSVLHSISFTVGQCRFFLQKQKISIFFSVNTTLKAGVSWFNVHLTLFNFLTYFLKIFHRLIVCRGGWVGLYGAVGEWNCMER